MWKQMFTIAMVVILMAACNLPNNNPATPQNHEPTNFKMDRNNDMNQTPNMNRQPNMDRQNDLNQRPGMNDTNNFNNDGMNNNRDINNKDDMNDNNLNREPFNEDGNIMK